MTEAVRRQQITQALEAYYANKDGAKDTLRITLRGAEILPVIEVPLDLPVLNARSFRIAPKLADHPGADTVRRDPESPAAQRIVADLVRASHRQAEELKESLLDEGQEQAGVITRSGKLINANTRCVLLRELANEGKRKNRTLRVAVLPSDFTNEQELELESVLQKQREHKDEYNLVGELMMIQTLHDQAKMTDAEINRLLRVKGGEKRVTDLRAVLDLMERARNLTSSPMPLSEFISEQDKRENWLALLAKVRSIDATEGRPAGDDHIRRWLIAYCAGLDSVHALRAAAGTWVEDDVLPDLAEGATIASSVAAAVATPEPEPTATRAESEPVGLDLLGDAPAPTPSANTIAVQRILDLSIAAKRAGDGAVNLPGGSSASAPEVREAITGSVKRGLDAVKRRAAAGSRIQRPANALESAKKSLKDAVDALDDVVEERAFAAARAAVVDLHLEIVDLVAQLDDILGVNGSSGSDD